MGEGRGRRPGPGQVRLRQTAVGLNFIDVYHRTGLYPQPLPFIPASRRRGGRGGRRRRRPLKPGDRVAYAGPIGAYAEERLIAADRLVKLPDEHLERAGRGDDAAGHDRADAAALGVSGREAGDTILVHAAAGGVGLILCQWARRSARR